MYFEPEIYFNKLQDKESSIKISEYKLCFRTGILICHKLLYYLLLGNYSEKLNKIKSINKLFLNDKERINYLALRRILDNIETTYLFITPHIFTKFIHELLTDKRINRNIFTGILDSFKEDFSYVNEEEVNKDKIINFNNFRNQHFGISETALIILKNKKRFPCILAENPKIFEYYTDDKALFINFQELSSFVREDERKNKLE